MLHSIDDAQLVTVITAAAAIKSVVMTTRDVTHYRPVLTPAKSVTVAQNALR